MIASRVLPVVALTVACALAACSAPPETELADGRTGEARSAVIRGKVSSSSQDAVVLLAFLDRKTGQAGSCTGTLIAPNLVLTARHCVSSTDEGALCKPDGTPISGGAISGDRSPEALYVFTGVDRPNFAGGRVEPAAQGKKVFHDGSKTLCNHDIALLLLDQAIKDAPIAPIRLDTDVEVGETITAVGWGVTEKTPQPDERQQRTNVKVLSVGPSTTKDPIAPAPNEFEVGESICSGDSGGPALSQETGAILGVVSRGGNGEPPNPANPSAGCIDAKNLYTKAAPFKDLILSAFEAAEAEPWVEGGPDPRKAKDHEACESDDDCRSALCLADPEAGGATTCAESCAETDECSVEGEVCTSEGDARVCRAPKPVTTTTTTTCSTSAPGGGVGGGAAVVFGLLALASLRRRRG